MVEAVVAYFAVLLIIASVVGFFLLVLSIIRLFVEQGWQYRYRHKCGHTYMFPQTLCSHCGEESPAWEQVTARPKWPWGWEIKK